MSIERYQKHLSDHLIFIERSAIEFDRGDASEALRIATSLRVIFHQTGKSTALLEHLNAWDIMLSSANKIDVKGLKKEVPVAPQFLIEWPSSYPNEDQNIDKYVTVREWWSEDPVTAILGEWKTRKDIVNWVANKDGGAHVQAILPRDYELSMNGPILTGPDLNGEILQNQIQTPLLKLRQFAHEVLNSPDLFKLANKAFVATVDRALSLFNTAFTLLNFGKNQEALDGFSKALELKPDYAIAWHFKGIALIKLCRYEEALGPFEKALAIKPDNASTWQYKGMALLKLGRHEEAVDASGKSLAIKHDNVSVWMDKCFALISLRRYEEALVSSDKAISIKSEFADAWINKATALFSLGRCGEALDALDKAIDINPYNAIAWKNKCAMLGILRRNKEVKKSAAKFRNLKNQGKRS